MDQPSPDVQEHSSSFCVTVREVMSIYRIGRCTAYEQAALFLRDGPGHGIPCMKIGNSLRFPVAWIEAHIGRPVTGDLVSSNDPCEEVPG